MWGRKYFYLVPFFLSFWAISGRAFFWGGIIYLAALDLRPAILNLRPAHSRALRSAIELYCTGTVLYKSAAVIQVRPWGILYTFL
jgi:hypothetical protein